MHIGRMVEWGEAAGAPVRVGDATLTPLARSLTLASRTAGIVWSAPSAVVVERDGRVERIPVVDVSRRIVWGLRLGALAAAWMVRSRRRRD